MHLLVEFMVVKYLMPKQKYHSSVRNNKFYITTGARRVLEGVQRDLHWRPGRVGARVPENRGRRRPGQEQLPQVRARLRTLIQLN